MFSMTAFSDQEESLPRDGWKEYKDDHFIIEYDPVIPDKYIRTFSSKCEKYYRKITNRLGFNRFNFWLWNDRAKVYVYNTREDYITATGRKKWSGAYVQVEKKIINTFYFERNFFDVILPHELTHIILKEFIGIETKVPLWFDEGVACANENNSLPRYLLPVKSYVKNGLYVSVAEMDKKTPANMGDPQVFYSESAGYVIFLLEEFGSGRFMNFCKELRDGETFWNGMNQIYGLEAPQDMDKEFLEYLNKKNYQNIVSADKMSAEW